MGIGIGIVLIPKKIRYRYSVPMRVPKYRSRDEMREEWFLCNIEIHLNRMLSLVISRCNFIHSVPMHVTGRKTEN